MHGSALGLLGTYAGPLQILSVKNSTHCDVESPTDLLGQLACGWVKPRQQDCFRATSRKFLQDAFAGNQSSDFTLPEELNLVLDNHAAEKMVRSQQTPPPKKSVCISLHPHEARDRTKVFRKFN